MKRFLKLSLVLLTLVLFNKHAYSCDALNIEIGSQISKASEVLDFLDEHENNYADEDNTVRYDAYTSLYCPDLELDNTKLQVFVYDSKIVGIKLVTYNPDIEKNQIYEYAKNKYGNLNDEVTKEGWTGYRILKSGNDSILYGKHETMYGIYEELDISTEELVDYTMDEEGVIEDNI